MAMSDRPPSEFLAECFWPGVRERDLRALDRRVEAATAEIRLGGERVRYLGSILLRQDEVVLCQFEGEQEAVREIADRARIPFARILEASRSPWTTGSERT